MRQPEGAVYTDRSIAISGAAFVPYPASAIRDGAIAGYDVPASDLTLSNALAFY
jgi:hypothetical protein